MGIGVGDNAKWLPIITVFLLIALAWYVIFGIGLVPAYSRDPLDVGIELDFANQ